MCGLCIIRDTEDTNALKKTLQVCNLARAVGMLPPGRIYTWRVSCSFLQEIAAPDSDWNDVVCFKLGDAQATPLEKLSAFLEHVPVKPSPAVSKPSSTLPPAHQVNLWIDELRASAYCGLSPI